MLLPRHEDPRGGRKQVPIAIGVVLTAAAFPLALVSRMLANLDLGVRQSRHRTRYEEWLARNLPLVEVIPVSPATASHYADLRLHLKSTGMPIPANDLWIAAMVKELRLPLLSNDSHFDLVPGLDRIAF